MLRSLRRLRQRCVFNLDKESMSLTHSLPKRQLDGCRWLVFTDLDGTLLSHADYAYDVAKPLLERLEGLGVPVHIASSKTFAEAVLYYREWGVSRPMIVENGAAIAWPTGAWSRGEADKIPSYTLTPTRLAYKHLRAALKQLRERHGWAVQGFGDWTAEQVAEHTGLDSASAARAKRRTASEPVLFRGADADLEAFRKALQGRGLRLIRGGRFHHIMGDADKADGVRRVRAHYQRLLGEMISIKTLCLGDSENDRAMLEVADQAIVVRRHDGASMSLSPSARAYCSEASAPEGWAEGVRHWFNSYKDAKESRYDRFSAKRRSYHAAQPHPPSGGRTGA